MTKSIISEVRFNDSKGGEVVNFGILDAEMPFRKGKGKDGQETMFANGLSFGRKNAALLLHMVKANPATLAQALEDYLAADGLAEPAPAKVEPTPAKVEPPVTAPKVEAPTPVKADPFAAFSAHVAKPATEDPALRERRALAEIMAPIPAPAPKPIVASLPATPAVKAPILRTHYKGTDYRKLPDGTVQFFQGDRADGKDRWVKYTGKTPIVFGDTPPAPAMPIPVKATTPTPAPATVKPGKAIMKEVEIIDGEMLYTLTMYMDGTCSDWKAHNMAVRA